MRTSVRYSLGVTIWLAVAAATASFAAPSLAAQDVESVGRAHGATPPPGYYDMIARDPTAYQFKTALIPWARRIMERRERAMRAMDLNYLNAQVGSGAQAGASGGALSASAVAGTIRIPAILFKFSNTTNPSLPTAGELETQLFDPSAVPPTYSARTLYDEMSRGMLTLDGDVFGPFTVSGTDAFYEGLCNGLPGACPSEMLGELLVEVMDSAEAAGVDFSPYDFDSDGQVDFVAFLHPEIGGECLTSNIWAHRFVLSSPAVAGSSYATDDGKTVDDYIIQAGVGGPTSCGDSTQVMPIGTFSHETGHAFGLPDLYDTGGSTEGIGHWGLMGAGSWNAQSSPAHMTAWSLMTMGWTAVDTLIANGGVRSLSVTPIIESDTAWAVCTSAIPANCLSEQFFLLENRVPRGSDVNVKVPAADGAGLLIWHVDPPLIASRTPSNSVNAFSPYALALEQADGLNELHSFGGDRGDTGDAWPGSTAATTFGPTTNPNSKLNNGTDTNIFIDSITVRSDSSITLTLSTGVTAIVTTNREGVTDVVVDGSTTIAPYTSIWGVGTSHTISVPDTQVAAAGDVRYVFEMWDDVAPPANQHLVTALDVIPDTFTATLNKQHLLDATANAGGSVAGDIGGPISLPYWADTTDVATLTATEASGTFDAFIGDTTTSNTTLVLSMDRPWSVVASFFTAVVITSATLEDATLGFGGYADTLTATGGNGTFIWSITAGALPSGMQLDSTGLVSGTPTEVGSFSFVAKARSEGINLSLEAEDTVQISVGAASLALNDVVDELLLGNGALDQDQLNYLDLIGNNNGGYDVGDLRAFLQATGQLSVAQPAASRERAPGAGPKKARANPNDTSEPDGGERPVRRSDKEGV